MRGLIGLAAVLLVAMQLPGAASAKDRIQLAVASKGVQVFAPLAAKELGYFDDEGLDVEVVLIGGGSKALAAVVSGDAQVYAGVPSTAFRARAKGTDATVFGAAFTQIGSNFVMAGDWASKHGITSASPYADKLKALRGMVVGVNAAGSGSDQVLRFIAKEAGFNPDKDMTIVGLGNGDAMIAALAQNRIHGFLQSAPVGENAIRNHGAIMFINTSRGEIRALDGFLYISHIARGDWLRKNESAAVRYLRAVQRALDTFRDPQGAAKARDAVHPAHHAKTDKALFDQAWEGALSAFPKTVRINEAMVKLVVDFTNEFEREPIDPAVVRAAWTDAYAEKATSTLERR